MGTTTARNVGYGDAGRLNIESTSYATAAIAVVNNSNNGDAPSLNFGKSRGTSTGAFTAVQSGDLLGVIDFVGANGSAFNVAARISVAVDGTVSGGGANDMPGRLQFFTTADGSSTLVERARIDASGNLGLGVTPSAWAANRLCVQIGGSTSGHLAYNAATGNLTANAFFDTTDSRYEYIGTGTATRYEQAAGAHAWYTAASGTAGAAITFAKAWEINASGHFLAGADNTYDIGASGATRPRDVFVGRRAVIDGITVGRGGQTTVSTNTAVGASAMNSASLTGGNNTAVGSSALQNNTTGAGNTAVGLQALVLNTTGASNSAVGHNSLFNNTTGAANSAVGQFALRDNTTGSSNSAVGVSALTGNTTGASNSAVGVNAMLDNTTGGSNSAVGVNAMRCNTTGANNSALGLGALRRIAGSNNVAVGFESGVAISRSVATLGAIVGGTLYTDGTYSGVNLTRSSGSTFDASPTANITVSGGAVTVVTLVTGGSGFQSTDTVLTAAAASIGGTGSGFTVAVATLTGAVSSNNTLLGYQAANTQTEGSSNIAIGSGVQLDSLTGSSQINIGTRYFHDRIRLLERATDPAKPAEGNVVLWMSDGAGLGDDGDVLIGSTAGGVTNYAILFDHSAGTLWP